MNVKQLRSFLAVAETLSFVIASERLHTSQSALSMAIKGLEESLGGKVFVRTTRSVQLTPEGESLLPLARKLLADWDSVHDELQQRFSLGIGKVSIAAMPSFAINVLPRALKQFRALHPKISVQVHDVINEDVIDMVQIGEVELGIGFKPYPASLAFEPLFNDQFVAIVPPGSGFEGEERVEWEALLQHPFISLQKPSAVHAYLEDSLRDSPLVLKTELEAHQLSTVGKMVATGLGVSVVPALCTPQMEALGAKVLKLKDARLEQPVGLIWHRERERSAAIHALYDVLKTSWSDCSALATSDVPPIR